MAIGASVGKDGVNEHADVFVVQHLLNDWLAAIAQPRLATDGDCGAKTIAAILAYQSQVLAMPAPDGLISPGGRTWTALTSGLGTVQLSGAAWWRANQARFPNSGVIADLTSPFREKAGAFVHALKDAGASVLISATRRNKIRAHLMHYSWRLANGEVAPRDVPVIAGCAIRWDHGDLAKSRKAAREMAELFDIAYEPSLTSLHIGGRALDMTIRWSGTIHVKDKSGRPHPIGAPQSGATNRDLHAIGASYGVLKLLSDPPHWSETGR
ncbi:peptidoglycan-binding domain-containing protein [Sphingomonas sp. M1-B02]|uniref:peptidoglycan-binding domain-containing protein n=1 Tax=Sphingomonas sp. M1-B02 TaxID=3114300 RepID=UPI00223EB669|nr:hypothetical protein [Sphingomonas sp. S6-11]UZK65982.1 hypothetical protein OKW87_15960 [Sphingomonas sp. S6-11]